MYNVHLATPYAIDVHFQALPNSKVIHETVLPLRSDVLDCLIRLHDYTDLFLPDALRKFFSLIPAPNERGQFLERLLDKFSGRYLDCNPQVTMTKGE